MVKLIFSALHVLYIVAISQALLITVYLLFRKKGSAISRKILALLMISFAIFLTGTYLLLSSLNWEYKYFAHLANLTVFLAPPLLYFYYQSLINQEYKIDSRTLLHTIPFFIIFLIMFYLIAFRRDHSFVFRPYGIFLLSTLFIQNLFYLFTIYKQRNGIELKKSGNSKARWFGYIFLSLSGIFVLKLVIFVLWNIFGLIDICIFFTGVFFIFSFIIINMLVIYGLFNPEILINYFRYENSSFDSDVKEKDLNNLLLLLDTEKLYLNPLISLDRLAKNLNISGKQLSQVINENTGNNFNDFINQYRIKEAQNLIKQDIENKRNILNIAYEVGFNSKSTFNTAFKKFTNSTPSEYRRKILNSEDTLNGSVYLQQIN
jgi:AraC-like DNA-binding protein